MIEPPISMSPSQVTSPVKKSLVDMIHGESEKSSISSNQSWQKQRKNENGSTPKDQKMSQSFSGRLNTFSPSANDKNRIVKVRLVRNKSKNADGETIEGRNEPDASLSETPIAFCEYKTISISSDERRAAVMKRALEAFKLDAESNFKRFSLVQLLHDKEIQIPEDANVFYAINFSEQEAMLLLLEEGAEIPQKVKRHQSTPHRPKKTRHRKNNSLSSILEPPETPRQSPLTNVASPMKSIYRQIAMGSVALVGGASYSPAEAPRRASDEMEVAGNDGIVLINSKSAERLQHLEEDADKVGDVSENSSLELSRSSEGRVRTSRCHSADFATGVVLPVRVIQPSRASVSSPDTKLPKSAPASPNQNRMKRSEESVSSSYDGTKVLTATGRLVEWPRYSRSTFTHPGRSATWSSRRALRKPKKHASVSTFYVSSDPSAAEPTETSLPSRSKFYVDMDEALPATKQPRPTTLYRNSHSSNTLPSRFVPDFSGHDYDVTAIPESAERSKSSRSWDDASVRRASSYNSLSSSQSQETTQNSDSGSGITFSAISNEDSVFQDGEKSAGLTSGDVVKAPEIKIQCASPDNLLDESGFFERYGTPHSESESQEESYENKTDEYTCL